MKFKECFKDVSGLEREKINRAFLENPNGTMQVLPVADETVALQKIYMQKELTATVAVAANNKSQVHKGWQPTFFSKKPVVDAAPVQRNDLSHTKGNK